MAHVDDANPAANANNLSAQIAWGDGTTTASTVTSAAGGGFDVSGTHTYNTAGNSALSTSIADVGGSTTSANSTAQIASVPPPPPPGPQAQFAFAPGSPCSSDRVGFDASASIGGAILSTARRWPITRYRWLVDDPTSVLAGNPAVPPVVTTTPTLTHAFGPAYTTIGQYDGEGQDFLGYFYYGENPNTHEPYGHFSVYDVRLFRPGVMVTLEVTDSLGKTASTTRRITFRNPDETVRMAYVDKAVLIKHEKNPYYHNDPSHTYTYDTESYYIDTYRYEPDVTNPYGIVGWPPACDSRSPLQKLEMSELKLRPAGLGPRWATSTCTATTSRSPLSSRVSS